MSRGKGFDRSKSKPLKRGEGFDRSKSKPIAAKSTKRRSLAKTEAAYRSAVRNAADQICEWPECEAPGSDVHHRAQRSTHPHRLTCPELGAFLCQPHHRYLDTPDGRDKALDNHMILPSWIDPPCTCADGRGISKQHAFTHDE